MQTEIYCNIPHTEHGDKREMRKWHKDQLNKHWVETEIQTSIQLFTTVLYRVINEKYKEIKLEASNYCTLHCLDWICPKPKSHLGMGMINHSNNPYKQYLCFLLFFFFPDLRVSMSYYRRKKVGSNVRICAVQMFTLLTCIWHR